MKSGKYIITLLLLGLTVNTWAQGAAAPAAEPAMTFPEIMTYILVGAAALLFIVAMIYVIKVNQYLYRRVLNLQAEQSGIVLPEESHASTQSHFWENLRKKYWEDPVPIEREDEIVLHHDYDGIKELDNSLPPWWVNMFILTVIWAVVYMFYYHWGGNGPSQAEEYQIEVAAAKKQIAVALAGKANAVDEASVNTLTDTGALGEGELIFKNLCAACHGQLGEGLVGPNFTDEYWIHGGGIKNVFKTIKYGVPEKGMISWASQLTPSDMQKVGSYILTLEGTNPPNPKAPQGDVWKEEATTTADTTATPEAPK
ncbi:MAG: c-type cytochrome [Lewinellaceae bacterium]|nr:c-type cytochrome [Lewinellaceae bacterium]